MQELNRESILVEYWVLYTENGEYKVTDKQMGGLLQADKLNARFAMFDDFGVNIAFVREFKKISRKYNDVELVPSEEKKFVIGKKQERILLV